MNLGAWTKLMFFGTMMSLFYIHMQMQIVDLAYKGKDKEHRFHELIDNNRVLNHQILALKSASYLGQQILDKDISLQFIGHESVMFYSGPTVKIPNQVLEKPRMKVESPLWNWLSFLSPQDAKAWDH